MRKKVTHYFFDKIVKITRITQVLIVVDPGVTVDGWRLSLRFATARTVAAGHTLGFSHLFFISHVKYKILIGLILLALYGTPAFLHNFL